MSESTAGQLTLRDINAKLQGAGLDILRPEQIKSIGAYTTRERFVQALEVVPANTSAVQFLRNIITRVTAPNQESAADESASVREVQDETAKPIQGQRPQDRASFHVYGGKAALCFEADLTRNEVHTIALDAATATGPKQYNWGKKVRLQLTRSELPIVTAVLLGVMKRCEFKNHGQDNSKGFSMERQDGGKVFIKVFAKEEGVKAVPVEAPDVFFVTSLFLRQLQANTPWMDAAGVVALIRATQGPSSSGA